MAQNILVDDRLAGLAGQVDTPVYPSQSVYTQSIGGRVFLGERLDTKPVVVLDHGIVLRRMNFDLMEGGNTKTMPFPGLKKEDIALATSRQIQWGIEDVKHVTHDTWYWNWGSMCQQYYAVIVGEGKITFHMGLQYPKIIEEELPHPVSKAKPSSGLFVELLQGYTTEDRIFNRTETVKTYINLLLQKFVELAGVDQPTAVLVYFHDIRSLEKYLGVPRPKPTLPPPSATIWEKYVELRIPEKKWATNIPLGLSLGLLAARFHYVLDRQVSSHADSFQWFFWLHKCLEDYHLRN